MITVTPADLIKLAPEFTSLNTSNPTMIETMISTARSFINEDTFGETRGKTALIFVASHLLTELSGEDGSGTSNVAGAVTMDKVGDLQRSYAAVDTSNLSASEKMFSTTKYGRLFIQLRKTVHISPRVL